jgi:hypothetical protein
MYSFGEMCNGNTSNNTETCRRISVEKNAYEKAQIRVAEGVEPATKDKTLNVLKYPGPVLSSLRLCLH